MADLETPIIMNRDLALFLGAVEALCETFSDEEKGEQWGETLKRLERLHKLTKKIRKAAEASK